MIRFSFFVLFLLTGMQLSRGQGCSDAGACSVGSLGLRESDPAAGLMLGYSQSIGLADKKSLVLGSEISVSHYIFRATVLEIKIPFLFTVGNLGNTSGVGDLLLTLSQVLHQGKTSTFLVAGGRLKTNDASKKAGNQPLPMVYQSSLGTNDIIAGLAWQSEKWSVSGAYQHSFGNNLNGYLHPDSMDVPEQELYFESAYLRRGDDLMVRIQRIFLINELSKVLAGALPVWRLQKDEIRRNGMYEQLPGSDGITFNLYFSWVRSFGENKLFSLSAGFPVYSREYRADGLTRNLVISAGLVFKFRRLANDNDFEPIPGLYDQVEY